MKRILCAILALALLLTTLTVPAVAVTEGVVPVPRQSTDALQYFVELRRADLDQHEYERGYDENGIATLTCNQDETWWANKYATEAPVIKVIFRVPNGAHSFKASFEDHLPEGAYTFPDSALIEEIVFPENLDDQAEIVLDKSIGTIENNTLTLSTDPFYALVTWFDESDAPLNNGKIEYIKVQLSFPKVTSPIDLPKSPVVPIDTSDESRRLRCDTINLTDYGFGCHPHDNEPGVWEYYFPYTLTQWENSWNQNGHQTPAVCAFVYAPVGSGATHYMVIDEEQVQSVQSLVSQGNDWKPLTNGAAEFYYDVAKITKSDDQYLLTTENIYNNTLIVWKNSNGLVDVGDEQYVESFTMQINHESTFTDAEIEEQDLYHTIAYKRDAPTIKNVYEMGSTDVPDSMTPVLKNGELQINAAFTDKDWQDIYSSKLSGNEQIWFHVVLPKPEGAASVSKIVANSQDDQAAENVLNGHYEPCTIWTDDGKSTENEVAYWAIVDLAAVRRHDSTILLEPCDDEVWLYASWRDQDENLINLGTDDEPCYVECLKITLKNDGTGSIVEIEDETTVESADVIPNASNWSDKIFSREAEFANSKLTYFVNRDLLSEIAEDAENGELPDIYRTLQTAIKAPHQASSYTLINTTNGIELKGTFEPGSKDKLVLLSTSITDNDGQLVTSMLVDQYEVHWFGNNDKEIGMQKFSIFTRITMNETWMDLMDGGSWEPAAKDRISSTDENTQIRAKADQDGAAKLNFVVNHPDPESTDLTLTVKAPDNVEITHYRKAVVDFMYVHTYVPENDSIMENARNALNDCAPIELNENRTAKLGELATFRTIELDVDKGNKNFKNTIYLHQTYNNNIEDCRILLVEWLDSNSNVISQEYVYHEPERLDAEIEGNEKSRYKVTNSSNGKHLGYVMGVRQYRQLIKGAESGEGAYYLHLWLEDESGLPVKLADDETVTVCLPYPEGSDSSCEFVVEHYEDESHTKMNIENCERRADGIYVTLSHFSPFMLSWAKAASSGTPTTPIYPNYPDDPAEEETPDVLPSAGKYIVLCRKLNVRAGAGTQYAKIGSLRRGDEVTGTLLDNNWVQITLADGTSGYICADYVTLIQDGAPGCEAGAGSVVCRKLNVRAGAGTQYSKIGSIRRGDVVEILGCDGTHSWFNIAWEDGSAWVCAKYITCEE